RLNRKNKSGFPTFRNPRQPTAGPSQQPTIGTKRQLPISISFQRVLDAEAQKPPVNRAVSQRTIIVELLRRRVTFLLTKDLCQGVVGVDRGSTRKPLGELHLHGVIDRAAKIAGVVSRHVLGVDGDPVLWKARPARNSADLTRDEIIRVQ